jgi:hypothetical protein
LVSGVKLPAMKLRGRAHKVTQGDTERPSSPGDDYLDPVSEYPDGREMAATGAEHIDADRAGWYRAHQCLPLAER